MHHPLLIALISLIGPICASMIADSLDNDQNGTHLQHRQELIQGKCSETRAADDDIISVLYRITILFVLFEHLLRINHKLFNSIEFNFYFVTTLIFKG